MKGLSTPNWTLSEDSGDTSLVLDCSQEEAVIAGCAAKMLSALSRMVWRRGGHPKDCARFEHHGDSVEVQMELCS